MKRFLISLSAVLAVSSLFVEARAEYNFTAGAQVNLGVGSNDFASYYLHANRHGKITQSKNAQLDIWAVDSLDRNKRFDFSWGIELIGGWANRSDYPVYAPDLTLNPEQPVFRKNMQGPAPVWIQQLYGEVKWRCLLLSVGLKDRDSYFVDQNLSSGDLLWSGNTRGIPEARLGFVDFQDIPWINGWVQFDIAVSYGKFVDTKWINDHFDYYTGKRNPGSFWTYKRASIRSKPSKPFSFQLGFQMSGIFGGWTYKYFRGQQVSAVNNYTGFNDFYEMLLPFWGNETEGYRVGDTKGTWDLAARYRFKNGETLRAYVQNLWEDSSALYKGNGWDGLWGLEFKLNKKWWIEGAVVEYLDLTNMSGPIAYVPEYTNNSTGATLPHKVNGRDSYYNNFYYRSYVNYGLNMGTPMVQGILFNNKMEHANYDGDIPYFRVRAIHIAIEGSITEDIKYEVKYNHRKAWGSTNTYALINPVEADSFMAAVRWRTPSIKGLTLSAALGVDHGGLPTNNVCALASATYILPVKFK